jgi:hypothetical protein
VALARTVVRLGCASHQGGPSCPHASVTPVGSSSFPEERLDVESEFGVVLEQEPVRRVPRVLPAMTRTRSGSVGASIRLSEGGFIVEGHRSMAVSASLSMPARLGSAQGPGLSGLNLRLAGGARTVDHAAILNADSPDRAWEALVYTPARSTYQGPDPGIMGASGRPASDRPVRIFHPDGSRRCQSTSPPAAALPTRLVPGRCLRKSMARPEGCPQQVASGDWCFPDANRARAH